MQFVLFLSLARHLSTIRGEFMDNICPSSLFFAQMIWSALGRHWSCSCCCLFFTDFYQKNPSAKSLHKYWVQEIIQFFSLFCCIKASETQPKIQRTKIQKIQLIFIITCLHFKRNIRLLLYFRCSLNSLRLADCKQPKKK